MKQILFHPKALAVIKDFSPSARMLLGETLLKLEGGMHIAPPLSRPMPSVAKGVAELRLRDRAGIYRVFYYLKSTRGVLVFHAFTKKDQRTPKDEITIGKKRLLEMLRGTHG